MTVCLVSFIYKDIWTSLVEDRGKECKVIQRD